MGEGTQWKIVPTEAPWRNGMAERAIQMAKKTLLNTLERGALLDFVEMETTLLQVSAVLNLRPIAARVFTEDDFDPVVPRDLLLGPPACFKNRLALFWAGDVLESAGAVQSLERVVEYVRVWWSKWAPMAASMLSPRRKWRTASRSVKQGDIVVICSKETEC